MTYCSVLAMSQREAARQFGVSRDSVRKMLAFSVPPRYRRTARVKQPQLDGFTEIIDGLLEGDREVHRKQRHMALLRKSAGDRVPLSPGTVMRAPR